MDKTQSISGHGLFKFKISAVRRDHFSSSDDDMDSEDYETESNKMFRKF